MRVSLQPVQQAQSLTSSSLPPPPTSRPLLPTSANLDHAIAHSTQHRAGPQTFSLTHTKPVPPPIMSVNVLSHPIVQAKLAELRDARTSSHRFRALVKELSTVLGIEASRELPVKDVPGVSRRSSSSSLHTCPSQSLALLDPQRWSSSSRRGTALTVRRKMTALTLVPVQQLKSPIASYTGKAIAPRVGLTPILRAGIGMTDRASLFTSVERVQREPQLTPTLRPQPCSTSSPTRPSSTSASSARRFLSSPSNTCVPSPSLLVPAAETKS